jgi:hypothetical protein
MVTLLNEDDRLAADANRPAQGALAKRGMLFTQLAHAVGNGVGAQAHSSQAPTGHDLDRIVRNLRDHVAIRTDQDRASDKTAAVATA